MKAYEQQLLIRYFILAVLLVLNVTFFYTLLKEPTIIFVYHILSIFSSPQFEANVIVLNGQALIFLDACIAGAAYFLLALLQCATPFPSTKNFLKALFFSWLLLFFINVLRILFLIALVIYIPTWFAPVHKIIWYAVSTIIVVGIWFWSRQRFTEKTIPLYDDVQYLYQRSMLKN